MNRAKKISPWHDIPLTSGNTATGRPVYNFVCEIPRTTQHKLEVNLKEENNPIMYDTKNGEIRTIDYHPYLFNYGYFPQTWEDPEVEDTHTNKIGDGDPIDVVDVGNYTLDTGDVKMVKIIGALAMIDEGETDWKIIAINVYDPVANKVNEPEDLEKHKPGLISSIVNFFRMYKTVEGKPENEFAFDGEIQGSEFAQSIIEENNANWKKLVEDKSKSSKYGYSM
eukprot:TRINITY_DN9016_c0_g1_i1.p1 TRINITY_DN9016_c0_g1~~TRINITY_DN9016_c0_g1_i1.p1  ORF type:complete len:224 (-),score=67.62 TRINITY_DN9016_c0_g1_i1:33-704(-)